MKGLLLKDFYMMKAYSRTYLVIVLLLTVSAVTKNPNLFFVIYPCLFCCMLPVSLLSYDERSHWIQYSGGLPYSRADLVSVKYLIAMILETVIILLVLLTQGIMMNIYHIFSWNQLGILAALLFITGLVPSALCLPVMFRFGTEKGRPIYMAVVAVVLLIAGGAAALAPDLLGQQISLNWVLLLGCVLAVILFAGSWFLSIRFFEQREL